MPIFMTELLYVSKPLGGGGGVFATRHYVFLKKKVLSAHYVLTMHAHRWHIVCMNALCALRGVLLLRVLKHGSSSGVEGGNETRPNSACPRDDQSSPCRRWINCLPDRLSSLWPQEERLDASGLLPSFRWTSMAVSDHPPL